MSAKRIEILLGLLKHANESDACIEQSQDVNTPQHDRKLKALLEDPIDRKAPYKGSKNRPEPAQVPGHTGLSQGDIAFVGKSGSYTPNPDVNPLVDFLIGKAAAVADEVMDQAQNTPGYLEAAQRAYALRNKILAQGRTAPSMEALMQNPGYWNEQGIYQGPAYRAPVAPEMASARPVHEGVDYPSVEPASDRGSLASRIRTAYASRNGNVVAAGTPGIWTNPNAMNETNNAGGTMFANVNQARSMGMEGLPAGQEVASVPAQPVPQPAQPAAQPVAQAAAQPVVQPTAANPNAGGAAAAVQEQKAPPQVAQALPGRAPGQGIFQGGEAWKPGMGMTGEGATGVAQEPIPGPKVASYAGTDTELTPAGFNPGGLASKEPEKAKKVMQEHPDQVAKGIEVEKEHSPNIQKRKATGADHLVEDKEYYDHLNQMEKAVKENKPVSASIKVEKAAAAVSAPSSPSETPEGMGELTPEQEQSILDFVRSNPNLDDSAFHAFCDQKKIDPHEAEEVVYRYAQGELMQQPEIKAAFVDGLIRECNARNLTDSGTAIVASVVSTLLPEFSVELSKRAAISSERGAVGGVKGMASPVLSGVMDGMAGGGQGGEADTTPARGFMRDVAARKLKEQGKSKNGVKPAPASIFGQHGIRLAIGNVAKQYKNGTPEKNKYSSGAPINTGAQM